MNTKGALPAVHTPALSQENGELVKQGVDGTDTGSEVKHAPNGVKSSWLWTVITSAASAIKWLLEYVRDFATRILAARTSALIVVGAFVIAFRLPADKATDFVERIAQSPIGIAAGAAERLLEQKGANGGAPPTIEKPQPKPTERIEEKVEEKPSESGVPTIPTPTDTTMSPPGLHG